MLKASDLLLNFGSNVNPLNFTLNPGTITWFAGKNGSGKSTLLLTLMGFQPLRTGKILYTETNNLFAYTPQKSDFAFGLTTQRVLELAKVDITGSVAEMLGIRRFMSTKVTELSGGEAQRILLGITFNKDAKYIFLDEPFASQDRDSIARIKELITEQRAQGKIIVITSHIELDADQIIELI